MQLSHVIFILCVTFLVQTVYGVNYRNFLNEASLLEDRSVSTDFLSSSEALDLSTESDFNYNSSELRAEMPENDTSFEKDQVNSTSSVTDQFQNVENSTDSVTSSSTHKVTTLTEIFNNESQPSSVTTGEVMSTHSVTTQTQGINESLTTTNDNVDDDEPEGVVRGKPSTTESVNATVLETETLYQKTLALISDTYTLSILVPVAAGVVFASTIIVIIATCRCLRRRCRRRRLRRKALPDSVKNLRPSDRARLLAESSDEEF